MKNSKALFRYNLYNSLTSPSFYIIAFLYAVLIPMNYFIRRQFFTSASTDLTLFFADVPYICIILVPALCYRQSFSVYEDFAPLPSITRIFVRFLSVTVQFCLMNILLIPSVLLINLFGSVDAGQAFIGFIILLCYGAAIISLCLCISELISNRVSVFVLSALVLALLNSAHLFAVYVSLGSFLTAVFKNLSFAWHFDAAGKGVFDTRDFIWLTASALLFIFLGAWITDTKKGKSYSFSDLLRNYGKIALVILIMLNGNRWYGRFDFSWGKTFTLSDYTKSLVSKVDSPVKITYFRSQSLSRLYPQVRDVSDFLSLYASSNKNISLTIKNPDGDEKTGSLLQSYGIQSQPLRSVSANSTEYTNVFSAIVIEYNGNAETIPFTMDAYSLEYDLDGRLKHLLSGSGRRVNIIVGNGMSLEQDYGYVVPWLSSQGFECNVVDFGVDGAGSGSGSGASWASGASVGAEALMASSGPLLVIGDGSLPVEAAICIEDYILSGRGNALFAISPYSAAIDDNWYITLNKKNNLVEMAENWGINFEPAIAADVSCARITMSSDDYETQVLNYPMWLSVMSQKNARLGADLFWVSPLSLSKNAEAFLLTSQASYSYEIDSHSPQNLVENNPFIISQDAGQGKKRGTQVVAAKVSGALEGLFNLNTAQNATVIVIPDQYFVNTLMQQYLGADNNFRNFQLLTDLLLSLNGEDELAELHSRIQRNSSLYKISDAGQLASRKRILFIVVFGLVPLLIVLSALLALLKPGRKNEKK
ncbi:MAG: Gldg family protein [Treponema sp.]|nr:Gldg family protein [Treponema sp.]